MQYIPPDESLPVPDGMCKDCIGVEKIEMCEKCKEEVVNVNTSEQNVVTP